MAKKPSEKTANPAYTWSQGKSVVYFPIMYFPKQGLSQDLESGCPKWAIVNILGIHIFKGDNNILRFQP